MFYCWTQLHLTVEMFIYVKVQLMLILFYMIVYLIVFTSKYVVFVPLLFIAKAIIQQFVPHLRKLPIRTCIESVGSGWEASARLREGCDYNVIGLTTVHVGQLTTGASDSTVLDITIMSHSSDVIAHGTRTSLPGHNGGVIQTLQSYSHILWGTRG